MDIKNFFSNIWKKIKSLFNKLVDYGKNNKIQAILIGSLTLLIIILIIILGNVISSGKKKNSKIEEQELILTENLLIPTGPEVQEDYSVSRITKEKWDEEEADEWFSIPTDKDIDSLGKSNDKIISDITGAAP